MGVNDGDDIDYDADGGDAGYCEGCACLSVPQHMHTSMHIRIYNIYAYI